MEMHALESKPRGEVQELSLLFSISQSLDQSIDLREVASTILKAMADHMGMMHGTLSLLNRESKQISIEAAYGLSDSEQARGKYKLGEGITGQVVQTGKPLVVPNISAEPLFLDRTGARRRLPKRDIAFICVPIKLENEVIGALSADRLFAEDVSFEEDMRLMSIIASMIAQKVRLWQAAMEERQRLLDENTKLQERLKDRFRPANIIGRSKAMQAVFDLIAQVCKSNTTVLIRGESGTGKELVAHAIHYNSPRAASPLSRSTAPPCPKRWSKANCSAMKKGRSPAPSPAARAVSSWPTAAPFFSTKSAT